MLGAPVLSATAALRTGSGWVQIAVRQENLLHALTITPELVGLPLKDDTGDDALLTAANAADAIAVGPGMGESDIAQRRLMRLLELDKPIVVDADALNMLARQVVWPAVNAKLILTPHPGEMKRLARLIGRSEVPNDDVGRIQMAGETARQFKQIVVLKGFRTVVTDGSRYYLNLTGNSALAKAGTGDVLTGIIASLIGQGMSLFDAAAMGTFLHGRAGELAGRKCGVRSTLARDVIDAIGPVISDLVE